MTILNRVKAGLKKIISSQETPPVKGKDGETETTPTDYWTEHNVTLHKFFSSREESLNYLAWRVDQYPYYDDLMPCHSFDDETILDYGCGPGHDIVGFIEYSNPKKVIGMDVSPQSLKEASHRIKLHKNSDKVEIKLIEEKKNIPLQSESVDYIHCSGVLHHTPNIEEILNDFLRILKPKGLIRIMVYNYDSIWAHLYVPYCLQIAQQINSNLSFTEAFQKSTDGENCPISKCYSPTEFISICNSAGFKTTFKGAAISLTEMRILSQRFDAMMNFDLAKTHRDFLKELTFNEHHHPLYRGQVAGIDAVYELRKIK